MRIRGTVKWFNETKGYGFLRRDDGQSDCFVHHSEIQSQGYRTLQEGERVEFDVIQQPKGPKASNVVKLDEVDSGAESAETADAGTTDVDAGATDVDAGTTDVDAGATDVADTGAVETAGESADFGGSDSGFSAGGDSEE